ncbi:hypothetical protein [Streptomyces noursei]
MPESPRWNPDTQSWETGPPRPVRPYTGPMPPRPAAPPPAGAVGPDPAGPAAPAYPPEPPHAPGGTDGAVLTYAYDSDRLGLRVQAVDCAFAVPDGRQFAVLVLGPESDWPRQETIQRIALESFGPSA